jgi:hypothetical protein
MSEFTPGQNFQSAPISQAEQDAKTGSGLAIASFVTSIATLFLTAGFFSFIGSILGHVSLSKLKKAGSSQNRGLAVAGIIIGWVSTAIAWIILIGFIILVVGLATNADSSWWDDFVSEFESANNNY